MLVSDFWCRCPTVMINGISWKSHPKKFPKFRDSGHEPNGFNRFLENWSNTLSKFNFRAMRRTDSWKTHPYFCLCYDLKFVKFCLCSKSSLLDEFSRNRSLTYFVSNILSPTSVTNIDVARTNFFKNSLQTYFNLTVIQMSSFGMITSVFYVDFWCWCQALDVDDVTCHQHPSPTSM